MSRIVTLLFWAFVVAECNANALWYAGDMDFHGALSNGVNTAIGRAITYNNFVVDGPGWIVREAWSNNVTNIRGVQEAIVEVRSGIRPGDGGVLVYEGRLSATQTATGRSGFGFDEFEIRVAGLTVLLGPGEYWLAVAPVGFGRDRSFITSTDGRNGVGRPLRDGNCYFDSPELGNIFVPVEKLVGFDYDYSMGVAGDVVPEPVSAIALSGGFLLLARPRRRRVRGPEAER